MAEAFDGGEDVVGGFRPLEGFGVPVALVDKRADIRFEPFRGSARAPLRLPATVGPARPKAARDGLETLLAAGFFGGSFAAGCAIVAVGAALEPFGQPAAFAGFPA